MLHPQSRRVAALWASEPSMLEPGFDIGQARELARLAGLAEPKEPVSRVADVDADGVPCRVYWPERRAHADAVGGTVVHLHGGGFVFGSVEAHDGHSRRIANRTGRTVVTVDYRLAPEHPWPAASDDVATVAGWLASSGPSHGIDTDHVALLGDSAGGFLAVVEALRMPGAYEALAVVYPVVDPHGRFPSYASEQAGGLLPGEMDWYWDRYVPDVGDRSAPALNPIDADLAALPPTLVITAEHDPLLDEGEALAARIADAGVPLSATRQLGMIHGFFRHPDLFDASTLAVEEVATFLRAAPSLATVVGP